MESGLIKLNPAVRNNFCFFCPVAKVHLNPVDYIGETYVVSPAIVRGLKAGSIIDVKGNIDLENQCFKAENKTVKSEAPKGKASAVKTAAIEEVEEEIVEEEVIEEAPKGKKASASKKASKK